MEASGYYFPLPPGAKSLSHTSAETGGEKRALDFLILQNDFFHLKNEELRQEIEYLRETEERLNRQERAHLTLKGYLKTLYETGKFYDQNIMLYDQLNRQLINWWILEKVYFLFWGANLTWISGDAFLFKILLNLVCLVVYFFIFRLVMVRRNSYWLRIKRNRDEIKKSDTVNELLHEMLDNF